MERSISNRYYFDYNATSPLSKNVSDFLGNGDFLFGNPSSLHTTGKKSKKFISETVDFLFQTFSLDKKEYNLIFHSGATEGLNTIFKGNAFVDFKEKRKSLFIFSQVDHLAVISEMEDLKSLGHDVFVFDVNKNGDFDFIEIKEKLLEIEKQYSKIYFNYTYVNNENGVVWPLLQAEELKKAVGTDKLEIIVDAVQLVGKIENWNQLSSELDAYIFSAHKFGAFKGVGFSFIKKNASYHSLIQGGNQQENLRSGTENSLGIYSIKLALSEVLSRFNASEQLKSKLFIEKKIEDTLKDKVTIVSKDAKHRNLNTIFFIKNNEKAESLSMKFDINSMDVSTGSACSSGIIKENRVLLSMGYNSDHARSCIRLSFSPYLTMSDAEIYSEKILSVLTR